MDTIEAKLSQYTAKTKYEDLSSEAIDSARRSTLDTVAAMLAGSSASGVEKLVQLVEGWGGRQEATIIGLKNQVPAPVAAWCNGTMARALEIDDCVDFVPVHPSASAVPALLATAESTGGVSGREFLTALSICQDLIIRFTMAVRPNCLESGRYNMFKIFGPTAAVARIMGLNAEQTQHALGISYGHAIGDGQAGLDSSQSLPLQQGTVAKGAVISSLLAREGFTGTLNFLDGRFGYFKAYEPNARMADLTDNLGKKLYGELISIKPFASCRCTHASIDLAMTLASANKIDPATITRIDVEVSPESHNLVAYPHETRARPTSTASAQFSIQYTVASALLKGDMFLKELDPAAWTDDTVLNLANRIQVVPNEDLRNDTACGKVLMIIHLLNGDKLKGEMDYPLGNPARPMDFQACIEKFMKCAEMSASPPGRDQLERFVENVVRLEELEDVSDIMSYLKN